MDRDTIKEIVRDVLGPNYPMRDNGQWVSMPCPLAEWKHDSGKDSKPSFGVSVNDDDMSICNCFTCGTKKPFHAFLGEYAALSGEDLGSLIREVEKDEFLGPRSLAGWDATKAARMKDVLMPLDEEAYMGMYESARGHPYLRHRGISNATAEKLELMLDPGESSQDKEERILFPVRGTDGLLYGFSGRAVHKDAVLKVKDYYGLKKANCILGAHLAVEDSRDYILVVEGLFDYANAWQCGEPGCAVMHSSVTPAQVEILQDISKKMYSFFDDDAAGDKGTLALCKNMHQYGSILVPTYPEVWIEDPKEKGGGHWLKDPGDMTEEEFAEMKAGATLYVDTPPKRRYSRRAS